MPDTTGVVSELRPRIVVIGVGGAGGNAVNNMIDSKLEGVEFVVANTDAQALSRSKAGHRLQLGAKTTQGLGAGARPEVGRQAAEDSLEEIRAVLSGAHMVFITAGMGGGTGTGAAPIIAQAARETGALAVAVVTKPFEFEGAKRMRIAEAGVEELKDFVDTLIAIPNQNLFRMATEKTTFSEAFALADEVLHSGVRGVTDLMTRPGLVNLDFADVRTVMNEAGGAMMGTGESGGDKRAANAAELAIANPLLDDVTLQGARAVLINITGGPDLTLYEVDEAANAIRKQVDADANIIVGSSLDDSMTGTLRVSVLATGISAEKMAARRAARPSPAFEPPVAEAAPEPAVDEPPAAETAPEPAPAPAAEPAAAEDSRRSPIDAAREELAENPTVQRAQRAPDGPEEFPCVPDEFRVEPDDPEAASEPDERRSGFGLFGRRRKPPKDAEAPKPDAAPPADPPGADFSDEFDDDELEIPAFLRRNAR